MPFNNSRNGFQNEYDFVRVLNNNKIKDIPFQFQLFIFDIFGDISIDFVIKCYKNAKPQKYDIVIEIGNIIKRISIKKGVKNSVHTEPVTEMIHFLIINKMPRNMVINFLKYHYADGSTNGNGEKRISASEYKKDHQQEIDEINAFINNKEFLYKAIDRFVVKGRNSDYKIDAIIYGVSDDFIWIKINYLNFL